MRFGGHCACVLGGSDRSFLRAPGRLTHDAPYFLPVPVPGPPCPQCCPALPSCPLSRQTPALPGVLPDPVPVLSWSCPGLVRVLFGSCSDRASPETDRDARERPGASQAIPGCPRDIRRRPEMSRDVRGIACRSPGPFGGLPAPAPRRQSRSIPDPGARNSTRPGGFPPGPCAALVFFSLLSCRPSQPACLVQGQLVRPSAPWQCRPARPCPCPPAAWAGSCTCRSPQYSGPLAGWPSGSRRAPV